MSSIVDLTSFEECDRLHAHGDLMNNFLLHQVEAHGQECQAEHKVQWAVDEVDALLCTDGRPRDNVTEADRRQWNETEVEGC